MIGVSLPSWLLRGEGVPHLDRNKTLTELKRSGVTSIEIRTVLREATSEDVLTIANRLWNFGFQITVHSRMYSAETAIRDIFAPLEGVLRGLRQEKLVLVLHPIVADNTAILKSLSAYATENGYPVTIALENNRLMPDDTEGNSLEYVLKTVKEVNAENVGLCFDLGHYMYYLGKHKPGEGLILPPTEFIDRIVHTHIHALNGLKTHYPLGNYYLPLEELLSAIAWRYFGVYNLELDFPRLEGVVDPHDALISSVRVLGDALPPCARLYDEIRTGFESKFIRATDVLRGTENEGTTLALANSTFYLFNTGGYLWAMDPAFRFANKLSRAPSRCAELLSGVKLMIITHGHVDHFEEETVRNLAQCDMMWVIPDFIYDEALSWGIKPERILVAHENQPICIDKLTILPFKGRHFRPITHKGVDEYGYYITAYGAPSMAFPADVRDYALDGLPELPKADVCFAHVFLGDGNSYAEDYTTLADEFARFMCHFSDKHFILTHLYENGRRFVDMWREEHADVIAEHLKRLNPDARITTPKIGEHIKL